MYVGAGKTITYFYSNFKLSMLNPLLSQPVFYLQEKVKLSFRLRIGIRG